MKEEAIKLNGIITDVFKGDNFEVTCNENKHKVICKPSGSIRKNQIKLLTRDVVVIEVSPYDLSHGRIVYRELTNKRK